MAKLELTLSTTHAHTFVYTYTYVHNMYMLETFIFSKDIHPTYSHLNTHRLHKTWKNSVIHNHTLCIHTSWARHYTLAFKGLIVKLEVD